MKNPTVTLRPAASAIKPVVVDLLSVLFGIPLRQAGLIWAFAPALVPRRSAVVSRAGQLVHRDFDHLGAMAGQG